MAARTTAAAMAADVAATPLAALAAPVRQRLRRSLPIARALRPSSAAHLVSVIYDVRYITYERCIVPRESVGEPGGCARGWRRSGCPSGRPGRAPSPSALICRGLTHLVAGASNHPNI